MLDLIKTLIRGGNARAAENMTDYFAIDLIREKIREAQNSVTASKRTLAALIVRKKQLIQIQVRMQSKQQSLEEQAVKALADSNQDLAEEAATAIAEIENECRGRSEAIAELESRISRLTKSLERAHRRIIDLRTSASSAEAMEMERKSQARLNRTISRNDAFKEAEDLIKRVTNRSDILEESEALDEVDAHFHHEDISQKLAKQGYADPLQTSANDVLERLNQQNIANIIRN